MFGTNSLGRMQQFNSCRKFGSVNALSIYGVCFIGKNYKKRKIRESVDHCTMGCLICAIAYIIWIRIRNICSWFVPGLSRHQRYFHIEIAFSRKLEWNEFWRMQHSPTHRGSERWNIVFSKCVPKAVEGCHQQSFWKSNRFLFETISIDWSWKTIFHLLTGLNIYAQPMLKMMATANAATKRVFKREIRQ